MRTKSTIKNGVWASASYVIIFILGLLARRAFLRNFDNAILGYSGVISNVFSLISLAELGVGTVISYGLYKEVEKRNKDEIAKLMMIYKWLYRVIGIMVLLVGIVCFFFLPMIIVEPDTNWTYVYVVYAIELTNAVMLYFLSFRRLLFVACQQEYLCIRIETSTQIAAYLVRIIAAYFTDLYIVYLSATMIASAVANIIISVMCNRLYPYARYRRISIKDMRELNVLHDIKAYAIQKLSLVIYGGIDNIIAMRLLGVSSVVMLTNYSTVEGGASGFFNKLLSGFQPGIGSLIYDENHNNRGQVFNSLNLLSFMLATFAAICYIILFQPFITLCFGEKYLLPFSYVVWFSINQYIGWNHRMLSYFRSAIGRFEEDQKYMISSAAVNVVLSILFVRVWGVAGLLAATALAHILQWIGRGKVVFSNIIGREHMRRYWLQQGWLSILAAFEVYLTILCVKPIGDSIIGFIFKAMVCVLLPNLINIIVIWRMNDFDYGRGLTKELLKKLRHRINLR
jgi:O-antigen/teichoic acid export membrane protein